MPRTRLEPASKPQAAATREVAAAGKERGGVDAKASATTSDAASRRKIPRPSAVLAEVGRLLRRGSSTMLRHRLVADSLHPTDLRPKRGSLQVLKQALWDRSWKVGVCCALTLSAGCSLLPGKKLNSAATKLDSYAADPDNVDPRSLPPNAKISKPKPTKPTAEILVDFAQVQFSLEHYDVAENMYNQALKLNGKYLPAYIGLSQVYLKQERPEKALEILGKVPKKSRAEPMILNEMAVVHCKQKDYRAAEELFKQALDADPENELFITNLAGVKAVTGNYDEAYRLYASKVGPAEARYRVAGVLYQQGNLADSQRQLELALKSNPKHEKSAAMLVELHAGRRPGEGAPSAPGAAATARSGAAAPEVKPAGFFSPSR